MTKFGFLLISGALLALSACSSAGGPSAAGGAIPASLTAGAPQKQVVILVNGEPNTFTRQPDGSFDNDGNNKAVAYFTLSRRGLSTVYVFGGPASFSSDFLFPPNSPPQKVDFILTGAGREYKSVAECQTGPVVNDSYATSCSVQLSNEESRRNIQIVRRKRVGTGLFYIDEFHYSGGARK